MAAEALSALRACRDYEHWASEVKRLTDAIAANECPRVLEWQEAVAAYWDAVADGREPPAVDGDQPLSHFREAAGEVLPGRAPDDGPRRRNLQQVETVVAHCWHCRDLATLIGARRYARKQFGIAKRRIRSVGKKARAATDTGEG